MAILLTELGLYERARIYATDYNAAALHKAKMGIFPLANMRAYIANYQNAGGRRDFADYYTAKYDAAVMKQELKSNIIFSRHDLTQDDVFSDMQLIVCRNVMIYFDRSLQKKVFNLFYTSLETGGFLCIGSRETILFSSHVDQFPAVNESQRIYQKLGLRPDHRICK